MDKMRFSSVGQSSRLLVAEALLTFFVIALGHRLYFSLGGKVVPYYFVVLPIVFVHVLIRYGGVIRRNLPLDFLVLIGVLSFYSVLSALMYERYQDLSQMIVYTVIPLVFFFFGFYLKPALGASLFVALLSVGVFFAFAQLAYTSFGYSGPGSLFSTIKEMDYVVQEDVLKRTLALRATGLLVEPNLFGFFSGLMFFWFFLCREQIGRGVLVLGMALSFISVVMSMSRGSLVAFLVAIQAKFLIAVLRREVTREGVVGFFSLLLVLAGVVSLSQIDEFARLGEIIGVIDKGSSESANLDARYVAWESLVVEVFENPFGLIVPPQIVIDESPDNQYLYLALQGGLVLLPIFLVFVFRTCFFALQAALRGRSDFLLCLIFFVVNNISITAMNSFCTAFFWLSLGVFSFQMREVQRNKQRVVA